jgi:hypothetical protein
MLVMFQALMAAPDGVALTIRYYDKKIYYQDSDILVKIELRNDSADTLRFKLADERLYNVYFSVKTATNAELPVSREYITIKNTNQPVFYRNVALEPGEELSFVENLSRYVDIPTSGIYIVEARFMPEFPEDYGSTLPETVRLPDVVTSNHLTLSIRPRDSIPTIQARIDEETGKILAREALPPDKVVAYIIEARQQGLWNKFFLYLDVEALMLRDPLKRREYSRASSSRRREMIEQYKFDIRTDAFDNEIVTVPSEYKILKTSYTADEAEVIVTEKFRYTGFTEVKRFTYYLRKRDMIWYIYKYDVRNLGTE